MTIFMNITKTNRAFYTETHYKNKKTFSEYFIFQWNKKPDNELNMIYVNLFNTAGEILQT